MIEAGGWSRDEAAFGKSEETDGRYRLHRQRFAPAFHELADHSRGSVVLETPVVVVPG